MKKFTTLTGRMLPLPVDNMIDVLNDLAHPSVNRVAPDGTRILAFGHALNKGVETLVDLAALRPGPHSEIR